MNRAQIERSIAKARHNYARAVEQGTMAENDCVFNLAAFGLLLGSYHARTFTKREQELIARAARPAAIMTCTCGIYSLTHAGRAALLELLATAAEDVPYTGE